MKIILISLLLISTSCAYRPMYNKGTCFEIGFLHFLSIDKVDSKYYYITEYLGLTSATKRFKHNVADNRVEKEGLIPIRCRALQEKYK